MCNSDTNALKNDLDLIDAKTLRLQYSSNPLIANLNINFLQKKIDALKEITKYFPLDVFCIGESKLHDSFPDHQFKMYGYQFLPYGRDRSRLRGGKFFYVKGTLIIKRLNDFKTNISETISLELTISNKEWFIMFAYNPLIKSNKLIFFNEGSNTLNKAVNKFDNILVTGDLNI